MRNLQSAINAKLEIDSGIAIQFSPANWPRISLQLTSFA